MHPDGIWTKANAQPGDALYVTKPLGTGLIMSGHKNGAIGTQQLERAVGWMKTLNKDAADLLRRVNVNAVTDVTGFGLLGHTHEMADRSGVRIRLESERFPAIDGALDLARKGVRTSGDPRNRDFAGRHLTFHGVPETLVALGYDPQTAGGLLVSLPAEQGPALEAEFGSRRLFLRRVGTVEEGVRRRRRLTSRRHEAGDDPRQVPAVPQRSPRVHARRGGALRRALGRDHRIRTRARILPEASDPARHLPESNPYTYDERLLMVKAAAARPRARSRDRPRDPVSGQRAASVGAYVPEGITQYLRLFSAWGGEKQERLLAAGYEVVILDQGAEKEISGRRRARRAALRRGLGGARPARGRPRPARARFDRGYSLRARPSPG